MPGVVQVQTGLPLAYLWRASVAATLWLPLSKSWEEGGLLVGGGVGRRGERQARNGREKHAATNVTQKIRQLDINWNKQTRAATIV